MFFTVNGLEISNLQKSSDGATITVDIVANHLTRDDSGEIILKEAFNKKTVQEFLDTGIIDYWHKSEDEELSLEERNAAIIGKPIGFRWENDKPVVTAQLTKGHEIVKNMMPHLEADQPVYAASVYGKKGVIRTKDKSGKDLSIIPYIKWKSLAIAPAPYVVNTGSGMNVKLLRKAKDILCEFPNFTSFENQIDYVKEEELIKALSAPSSSSDLYDTPGGSVTKQSMEKKIVNLTLSEQDGLDLIDTIIGIKEKRIPLIKSEYYKHFDNQKKNDFGRKSYGLINKYFKIKKERK